MKKVFLILLFTASCKQTPNVILWKSYHTYTGKLMPKGVCRFGITGNYADQTRTFEDSCHLYHVNDTLR